MLEIFDGRPGDGKTYGALLKKILPHLADGGFVATNIEVNHDGVAEWIKHRTGKIFQRDRLVVLQEEDVAKFYEVVPAGSESCQVLVVIDEAHLWFNSRDYRDNDKNFRDTFNLATQHRKHWLDIILITQHFANIDSQFLRLTETIWRFRDLKKTPLLGILPIPFFRFLANVFDRNGKKKLEWFVYPFEKLVGASYNTRATLRGSVMAGSVQKAVLGVDPKLTNKVRRTARVIVGAVAAALLFGIGWLFYALKIEPAQKEREESAAKKDQEIARLRERLTEKPTAIARPVEPVTTPVKVGGVVVDPDGWLASKPKTEVLATRAVCMSGGVVRIRVELDGLAQWLQVGAFVSKGRVMSIIKLSFQTYDVEISDDDLLRHRIRCVLAAVPDEGAGAQGGSVVNHSGNTNTLPNNGIDLIK